MSDYIKREDAIQAVKDSSYSLTDGEYIEVNGYSAIEQIEDIPSADVVEVVRCKDCIFNNDGWCGADHLGSRWIEAEDYCSFGERKEREHK